VAIFDSGSDAFQTSTPGTAATLVFGGSTATLAGLSPAVTLRDVTIINTGATTCFVGSSSVTAAAGLPLKAGQQVTIQGWTTTTGTTTNDIYAITSSGTTTCNAGLATVAAVV
jgi:hypothetical protein